MRLWVLFLPLLLFACTNLSVQKAGHEGDVSGECSDGSDNDSDGDFDCEDSDCLGDPTCDPACPGGDNREDSDADGVCDAVDLCPGEEDAQDQDADGVPDGCDPCPIDAANDSDGDGVCDSDDLCPGQDDTADEDLDGVPDACDPCPSDPLDDSDNDGVCDSDDLCPGSPDSLDGDLDGVPDGCDLCPGQDDTLDTDLDGVPDGCDPCPLDLLDDSDGDGICDSDDACPNFDDSIDFDNDGQPDLCDPCPLDPLDDSDGDGVCDSDDVCPAGDDTVDLNSDGVPDDCAPLPLGHFIVSDSSQDLIHHLDELGTLIESWPSPVSQVRGVAWDGRNQDGLWVLGNGDLSTAYKINTAGGLIDTFSMCQFCNFVGFYGLDYLVDPSGVDRLAFHARQDNGVDVLDVFKLDSTQAYSSLYLNGGIVNGEWGVSVVSFTPYPNLSFQTWTSWTASRVEYWQNTAQLQLSFPAIGQDLRGITQGAPGDLYVVSAGAAEVLRLDSTTGALLSSFLAPGPTPEGIDRVE